MVPGVRPTSCGTVHFLRLTSGDNQGAQIAAPDELRRERGAGVVSLTPIICVTFSRAWSTDSLGPARPHSEIEVLRLTLEAHITCGESERYLIPSLPGRVRKPSQGQAGRSHR
jgi:hypothetical protein